MGCGEPLLSIAVKGHPEHSGNVAYEFAKAAVV